MLFILFKFIDYFLIKIMFHARKCSKQAACSKKLAVHKLFLQVFKTFFKFKFAFLIVFLAVLYRVKQFFFVFV